MLLKFLSFLDVHMHHREVRKMDRFSSPVETAMTLGKFNRSKTQLTKKDGIFTKMIDSKFMTIQKDNSHNTHDLNPTSTSPQTLMFSVTWLTYLFPLAVRSNKYVWRLIRLKGQHPLFKKIIHTITLLGSLWCAFKRLERIEFWKQKLSRDKDRRGDQSSHVPHFFGSRRQEPCHLQII